MRIRSATLRDADTIAQLYLASARDERRNILLNLGTRFLKAYHEIMLLERDALVLCAENGSGAVVGFVTGSLDVTTHLRAVSRFRLRLLWAALPALLRSPHLIGAVLRRQRAATQTDSGYVVSSGCRIEYWAWAPDVPRGADPLLLMKAWLAAAWARGAAEIGFEVNEDHEPVARLHKALGAELVRRIVTPDGQARSFMRYKPVA